MFRHLIPLLLAAPLLAAEEKIEWKATLADALAEAKSSKRLVLLEFFGQT